MKINYSFAKDNAGLVKIQDKAIRAANSARVAIQVALVATVKHLAEFHDVNMASRLVDGLHETVRGRALVDFLTTYGHVKVGKVKVTNDKGEEKEVDGFVGIVGDAKAHAEAIRASWEACKATMWWSLKQESPYKGFDMEKALQSVLTQAQKAADKLANGEATGDMVNLTANDAIIQKIIAFGKFDLIGAANEGGQEAAAA